MGRKFGWHSGKLSCKELDVDDTLSFGSLNFGAAELDTLLLNGRLATGTSAGGTSLGLGATYAYGEAIELRYNVTSWTGIGSSFKALYLRSEADLGGSFGLRAAELYGVMDTSTTTGLSNLQVLYTEMLIKASASNRTLTNGNSIEANISIENQTGTLTLTNNIYCLYAKAQTGTGLADYTKVNGIKIAGRDDGTARVFGNALDIANPEATVCTWTNGINLTTSATTGMNIATGTFTDAIKIAGTTTDAIDIGTVTNGVNFTGTITRGVDFTSATISPHATAGTNSAITIGRRGGTAITHTLVSSGAQHWDPVQFNIIVAGVNPDATSTMNMIYQNIAHSTADMAALRLKGSDWTMDIQKNVLDAYVYQGEIDFSTNALTVGGEAAGLGITMSATSAVTGNVWGAVFAMSGSGLGTSAGVFVSARSSAVLTHGLYVESNSGATVTNGVYINASGTITNAINIGQVANTPAFANFNAGATDKAIEANTNAMTLTATSYSIRVTVGGSTVGYIPVFDTKTWT